MRKQFHTPAGIVERELTPEELKSHAARGDAGALREILRDEFSKAATIPEKLDVLARGLGLK